MALFGLSPFLLSLLASRCFTDPYTGLDVTRFLSFLALASGIIHLVGAFTLRISTPQCAVASISDNVTSIDDDESSMDERQPLLSSKAPRSAVQVIPVNEGSSILHLLKNAHFWLLALVSLLILGSVSDWFVIQCGIF